MVSTGRGEPPDNPRGGVENEAYLLVNSLAKNVKSIHYVEKLSKTTLPENVFVHNPFSGQPCFGDTFLGGLLYSPILAFRVANMAKQILAKYSVQLIHFHETRGNLPVHFLFGSKDMPTVLSIHGPVPWTVKYDSKIETFVRIYSYRFFDVHAFKRVDHLIAVSHWLKRKLMTLGLPDNRISVIYNPIDTSVFSPERNSEKMSKSILDELDLDTASYFFTVGSLVSRKRHIDLIRAFASYKGDKKLVIVGNGPGFPNVNRLICRYGLNHRIKILRRVESPCLPYLYANAHAFVTCSLAEGLPVSIMEAMSSGLGIISPNTPWIEELVGPANGVLFSPFDDKAITDALTFFDDNSSKLLGMRSRRIAETSFSLQTCATSTSSVYESLLEQRD
ncbi:MAG TPA: glycosyltransferase family 4 protein [Candidatus Sulfotelmatobacter sp.]|nr:glycosyltransferase family 4 protein [Candidatus Sulfotelmatobacter sp.]